MQQGIQVMKRNAIIVVSIVVVVTVVGLSISRGRELSKRLVCSSNMKHIGTSIKIYATDTTGEKVVEQLVRSGVIPKDSLICPSSELQQRNYLIVTLPAPLIDNRTVVMYEPKSNHRDGGNFLFADGHTSFIIGEQYDLIASNPTSWWEKGNEEE